MNITFCDGMLLQVSLSDNTATMISKQEVGNEIMNFYNHFSLYKAFPDGQLLNLYPDSDSDSDADKATADKYAIKIINSYPLTKKFYSDSLDASLALYSKEDAIHRSVIFLCNCIQNTFSNLDAALSEHPDTGSSNSERFNKAIYMFTHEDLEDVKTVFKSNPYPATFVLLDSKIIQVYTVQSLVEYLSLDFFYTYFSSDSIKQIAVCPCCKKAFRMSQRNKLYCSKSCKDKSIKANNNRSPYYSKFRYLQQYHNRQLNELRSQKTDSSPQVQRLQGIYDTWNEWARSEYEQATHAYNLAQQKKFEFIINVSAYRQAQANNSFPDFETESDEEFGERLKAKWKELKRGVN